MPDAGSTNPRTNSRPLVRPWWFSFRNCSISQEEQPPGIAAAGLLRGLVREHPLGHHADNLLARRVGIRSVTVAAALGFLFIVGAGFNGASFLDFQADYSSLIMATLFGLAVLAYAVVLFLLPADA